MPGGDAIWALLNLELWYRTFIDGDGVQTLPEPERASAHDAAVGSVRLQADPSVRLKPDTTNAVHRCGASPAASPISSSRGPATY